MTIILTDRSRIEDHEKCPRRRYWRYHYGGKGLEKAGDLKLDARIGTGCHDGIEEGLQTVTTSMRSVVAEKAGDAFALDCCNVLSGVTLTDQQQHDIKEGSQIVTALTYAWLRTVAPRLLSEGEVLAIEKELTVDLPVATPDGSTIVRLMTRPDIIWRRKSDGTIFIRNLKTTRRADVKFTEKWALDQQTLSEPLAVDEWLRHKDGYNDAVPALQPYEQVCGGVIIDGLVTGEVLWDKYRSLFYHNNSLIYCWRSGDIGVGSKVEFYPKYEWTCTAPHKFANGRKCEGGRTHKLSGVTKVAVADAYPGGIISWIDYLIANHPDVVAESVIELQPVIRSDYQIERWKRQVLPREVAISRWATQVNAAEPEQVDAALDAAFPMHTSNGNCLYPGKCFAFDLCHGTAAADPLAAGYQFRVPNHPQEKENTK